MTAQKKPLKQSGAESWSPHKYQEKALKFVLSRGEAALFLDPGMGKTSISYAACKVLRNRKEFKGALVVAPRRPAISVWPKEQQKWVEFHELSVAVLHGPKREELVKHRHDIYVITYEGLQWLIKNNHLRDLLKKGWLDVLIVDELSKVKHQRSLRHKTLAAWHHRFARRIGLTGSPASNGLMDLFGQAFVLDMGKAFGQYESHFRAMFFTPVNPGSDYPTFVPKPGAEELIYARMKHLALRLDADDWLKMPQVIPNVIKLELDPKSRTMYDEMEKDFLAFVAADEVVTAASAAAASMKCRQIATGCVYEDKVDPLTGEPRTGKRKYRLVHDLKIEALEDLVDELQGQQLLIAYEFGHDRDRILKLLGKDLPWIGGGTSDKKALEYERAWNAKEIPILLGHPASIGHGLNFQESSAYNILFFTGTWDFELYDQFVRRLRRQGNKANRLLVHRFVMEDTVEEAVLMSNNRKRRTQDLLHDALKTYRVRRLLSK
jgi:SNF2 family DNA or RNA helicase